MRGRGWMGPQQTKKNEMGTLAMPPPRQNKKMLRVATHPSAPLRDFIWTQALAK